MTHAGAVRCACVADHAPEPIDVEIHHVVPLAWGGPDSAANRVNLCGNAHNNVHAFLRAYQRAGGTPPWDVRRRFSPYIRALAARGWAERPVKRTTP